MPRVVSLAFTLVALMVTVNGRTIFVRNNCPFTIWPALFTGPGGPVPNHATGWEAPPGNVEAVQVPDNWVNGRIWGRTGCNFNIAGPASCETGGCNGGFQCDRSSGTGVPPASLAEWSFTSQDFYDVSLVDGFNLPIRIEAAGCPTGECRFDLNPNCPAELRKFNARGAVVGCKSACFAGIDGNSGNSANCCTGSHNRPETCPSSGVQFYNYFHNACPNAYNYAFDDPNGLKSCNARPNYTLTFCP